MFEKSNEEDFPKSKIRIHHFIGFRCEWTLWRINLEIVDKADPEDEGGNTPLHFAARNGHFEVCQLIVNNITKKNPKNFIGETPIQLASDAGHSTIVMMVQASLGKKFKLGWLDEPNFPFQTFIYHLTISTKPLVVKYVYANSVNVITTITVNHPFRPEEKFYCRINVTINAGKHVYQGITTAFFLH